jgi:hypothetical protein
LLYDNFLFIYLFKLFKKSDMNNFKKLPLIKFLRVFDKKLINHFQVKIKF